MSAAAPIDFYFEFSSPYGYIAAQVAEELEERLGRALRWRPILLGPIFRITGQAPLTNVPLKGDYAKRDFARTARMHQVDYRHPERFPIGTVAACRAFYATDERDPRAARALAKALYRAYFVDNRDIGDAATTLQVAQEAGLDAKALGAAIEDPRLKERVKGEVDSAIAAGVFGSPFFIADGEPFWGVDRIPMLEEWVRKGGW
ncbi:MAG TPA: 2-hydroxychromene-2-carboxylate isomerase [Usitatibacter sp.]|nr:2-hydroxychromene-2-carboxylate isomerase [Usitatibacter sp.]